MSATTDQPSSPEQWVSIQEAAQRLGLSVLTVRRRIKAGTLTAELQVGRRGHEYRVRLLADQQPDADQSGSKTTQGGDHDAGLSSLVSKLQDQIERLESQRQDLEADRLVRAEAAASWQAKGETLQDELRRAYERLEKLERRQWWQRIIPRRADRPCPESGYMLDVGEEALAELSERWQANAATLRAIAARCVADGSVESATLLHKLAASFETQARRRDTKPAPPVT